MKSSLLLEEAKICLSCSSFAKYPFKFQSNFVSLKSEMISLLSSFFCLMEEFSEKDDFHFLVHSIHQKIFSFHQLALSFHQLKKNYFEIDSTSVSLLQLYSIFCLLFEKLISFYFVHSFSSSLSQPSLLSYSLSSPPNLSSEEKDKIENQLSFSSDNIFDHTFLNLFLNESENKVSSSSLPSLSSSFHSPLFEMCKVMLQHLQQHSSLQKENKTFQSNNFLPAIEFFRDFKSKIFQIPHQIPPFFFKFHPSLDVQLNIEPTPQLTFKQSSKKPGELGHIIKISGVIKQTTKIPPSSQRTIKQINLNVWTSNIDHPKAYRTLKKVISNSVSSSSLEEIVSSLFFFYFIIYYEIDSK